ncbi:hypothetical protein [Fimbriimonas ginsengisoli]|uniref:hypothetical protein n=1 Tax=Fimbriimonas ginsengisoli TaxID=1005039 RepID=UPI001186C72D|nr:hypothetical protein [Fimbriimonas ginsengisoli]
MLRVGWQPGRGFILSLTDSTINEVSTPPIPAETLSRALEGRCVALRHAGHSVEIAPIDGCIRVKTGPSGGTQIEGTFRPEDLEKAMRVAVERPSH